MSNTNLMKGAFENLRFPKKIKEAAVAGKDYKDAKSYQQFYRQASKMAETKKAAYQKAIDAYKPDRTAIRLLDTDSLSESMLGPLELEKGERWLLLRVRDIEEMDATYNSFHNVMAARIGLRRMRALPEIIKELQSFEDNEATKSGVAELQEVIKESDPLMALILSSTKEEDKEVDVSGL